MLTWEKGRQLKTYGSYTYQYNKDGIRTQKIENGKTHDYILDGTSIIKEIVNNGDASCQGYTNEYLYDIDGSVCGIIYNGTSYYFYKNLQGDVIAIADSTGTVKAAYTYDAWGKCTVVSDTSGCNIANINPFRYRGYYYDAETQLYYLQSRYYDPEVGRFICSDESCFLDIISDTNNYNLYAYCSNNAVNLSDYSGYSILKSILSKIEEILNKAVEKFKQYLKNDLFRYDRRSGILSVSTTVLSIAIDVAIAVIIRKIVYNVVKKSMKALLKNATIRQSFIGAMFDFFLYTRGGKFVLWVLLQIGFIIAGKPGALGTITGGVFQGFLENILSTRNKILGNTVSFINAFSSIGGIIALFLDGMDRSPDGWIKIKIKVA